MKRTLIIILIIIFWASLFTTVCASWDRVYKFKKVQIPLNLKFEGLTIKKGEYDLEILKVKSVVAYTLRIIKKKKFLCTVPGEFLTYKTAKNGMQQYKDPNIPVAPTLKMQTYPKNKLFYIIFESGKRTIKYPFIKIRFKLKHI
jgi:hypothetical protein